ncbi:MAG: CheY-like chemotaxis protein [Alphaproteobacteria bacterium]|jgi:CheY-like chemotaxis protein
MSIEKKNILVVDDSEDIRILLIDLLEGAGANAVGCEDGNAAISRLDHDHFDLVVTDILMPNKDGVAVIRNLKEGKNPTPILAISGGSPRLPSHWMLKITETLGVDAVLHKPFEPSEFLATVSRLV